MSEPVKTFDDWLRSGGVEHYGTYTNMARQAWRHQQAIIDDLRKQLPPAEPTEEIIEKCFSPIRRASSETRGYRSDNAAKEVFKEVYALLLSAIGEGE